MPSAVGFPVISTQGVFVYTHLNQVLCVSPSQSSPVNIWQLKMLFSNSLMSV